MLSNNYSYQSHTAPAFGHTICARRYMDGLNPSARTPRMRQGEVEDHSAAHIGAHSLGQNVASGTTPLVPLRNIRIKQKRMLCILDCYLR